MGGALYFWSKKCFSSIFQHSAELLLLLTRKWRVVEGNKVPESPKKAHQGKMSPDIKFSPSFPCRSPWMWIWSKCQLAMICISLILISLQIQKKGFVTNISGKYLSSKNAVTVCWPRDKELAGRERGEYVSEFILSTAYGNLSEPNILFWFQNFDPVPAAKFFQQVGLAVQFFFNHPLHYINTTLFFWGG